MFSEKTHQRDLSKVLKLDTDRQDLLNEKTSDLTTKRN